MNIVSNKYAVLGLHFCRTLVFTAPRGWGGGVGVIPARALAQLMVPMVCI